MIVPCWEPDRPPQARSTAERIPAWCTNYAQAQPKPRRIRSGGRRNAATGSGRSRIRMWTVTRTQYRPHLLTARTHGGVTEVQCITRDWRLTATHPCRRSFGTAWRIRSVSGSHLGSTLRSGRAVLTRGVSRRSGSVACIHADASPTEVLANPSWHRNQCSSNILGKEFGVTPTRWRRSAPTPLASGP
jgi:hypothetical protein